ncbi:MAG TPA: hypothetical protein VM537_37155 [Anaerolineae bacterium]|nr:hypothetical protein [Anaerolineae bacterium]
MLELRGVLARFATRRPIFHSEADFQHELAWEIRESCRACPACAIRLEAPFQALEKRGHLDIVVRCADGHAAIELKYKTRRLQTLVSAEEFSLLDQSAPDHGRYDFCKDIERLERFVSRNPDARGFALLLTNDPTYWKSPRKEDTVDADFRLHDKRVLAGRLKWQGRFSKGTVVGREAEINIRGAYRLAWQDYAAVDDQPHGRFRYALVEALAPDPRGLCR